MLLHGGPVCVPCEIVCAACACLWLSVRRLLLAQAVKGLSFPRFLFATPAHPGVKVREELAASTATVCDKFACRYLGGS